METSDWIESTKTKDANDYPLFPTGVYYGDMVFTSGLLNAIVAHPSLGTQLSKSLLLDVHCFFLWRQRTTDGLYSQTGMFLRTGATSRSRYVGATQDSSFVWHVDRHTTVRFVAAYYEVGPYLRETQSPGKNTTFFCNSELQVLMHSPCEFPRPSLARRNRNSCAFRAEGTSLKLSVVVLRGTGAEAVDTGQEDAGAEHRGRPEKLSPIQ